LQAPKLLQINFKCFQYIEEENKEEGENKEEEKNNSDVKIITLR
jgi:hypothetical protein